MLQEKNSAAENLKQAILLQTKLVAELRREVAMLKENSRENTRESVKH